MNKIRPNKEEKLIIIILLSICFGFCVGVLSTWGHCDNPDHFTKEEVELIVIEVLKDK
tara:strand:+ start:308 stop:481 length:174 start_codon:yes stop_codon:yes gene_type:complete